MRQPETFVQLVDSIYNITQSSVISTPISTDGYNQMPGNLHAAWLQWEWTATQVTSGLAISRDPQIMGQIYRIPDSVLVRERVGMNTLIANMPRGSR